MESTSSLYLGLTNNHIYRRFTLGYGLSLSKDAWRYNYFGDDDYFEEYHGGVRPDDKKFVGENLGLLLSTYYSISNSFHIGVMYRPNLIHFNSRGAEFRYGHLVTIDFAWRIRLKTGKRF